MNNPEIETELAGKINQLNLDIKSEFKVVNERLNNIDNRLVAIETRMDEQRSSIAKIPDLAEKVGELKNWRQIALIVIAAVVSGVLGWILRSGRI
ncbi:MAG TPA: hypothetical protein ACFCUY_12830 [Xenococcaceae cyanobacterium]